MLINNYLHRKIANTLLLSLVICFINANVSAESVPGPETKVEKLMGRPTFFIDGKPFNAPLFATYVPTQYYYDQMAEMGSTVFNFQTNCCAS